MILFLLEVVLLVDHVNDTGHDLEILMFLVKGILVVEKDLQLIVGGVVNRKVTFLLALEGILIIFRGCLHSIEILTIRGRAHII